MLSITTRSPAAGEDALISEFFEFLGPRGHSPVRKTREGADQVRRRAIDENFQLEVVRFRDGRKTLPSGQNQEGKRGH